MGIFVNVEKWEGLVWWNWGRRKFGINRKKDSDRVLAVMNQSGSMQLRLGLQYTRLINFISFYVFNVYGKS